jgi:hypothetical protein
MSDHGPTIIDSAMARSTGPHDSGYMPPVGERYPEWGAPGHGPYPCGCPASPDAPRIGEIKMPNEPAD